MKRNKLLLGLTALTAATLSLGLIACDKGEDSSSVAELGYEYKIDRPYYWGKEGEILQLNVFTDNPAPVITWSSDKESVATVSATGEVTMKTTGQAKITATVDGTDYICNLTVEDRLVEFYFDAEKVEIATIQDEFETSQTVSLTVDVNFETLETPNLTWTTGDPSVASVENGTVTAVGKGFTTVTATISVGGKTYASSLDVSVYPHYQRSTLAPIAFEQGELGEDCKFKFTSEKKIEYVKVDETVLDEENYEMTADGLLVSESSLNGLSLGRHSLWIAEEKDATTSNLYEYPFAVANVAIRDKEDLKEFIQKVGTDGWGAKGTTPYFALDADIDCGDEEAFVTSSAAFYGTFDGLGHKISNMKLGAGGRGMFGNAIGNTASIFDFSLIGVTVNTGQYGGALTGILYGVVENVFISGTNANTAQAAMLCNTLQSEADVIPTIKNCIVIDNGNLGNTSKRFSSLCGVNMKCVPKIENVLCVTNGYSVHATEKVNGLTGSYPDITSNYETLQQVKPENAEGVLNALKGMHGNGNWTFDETAGQLKLLGNSVYTYKIPKMLEAQIVKVNSGNEVSLVFDKGAVVSLTVNGTAVQANLENNVITFKYASTGKNEAKIETENGDVYGIPFVLADYVLSTPSDVTAWVEARKSFNSAYKEYTVLANDIDLNGAEIGFMYSDYMYGTFDGCGHKLENFTIKAKTWGFLGNVAGSAVVKDFAMVNVTVEGYSALCGTTTGTFENIFIQGAGNASYGLFAGTISKATISNCVVIDTNSSLFALGRLATGNVVNASNNVVVTDKSALYQNSTKVAIAFSDATYVSGTNNAQYGTEKIAEALAAINGVGGFTYDSATGELFLNGTKVYALS